MAWQQYQTTTRQDLPLPVNQKTSDTARRKNRSAIKEKIRELRHHSKEGKKRLSSVSLPVFTRSMLRHGVKRHRETFQQHWQRAWRRRASESDILLACLVLLLSKLKCREGLQRRLQGPRYRLYNDNRYSYETVTVYAERGLWLALQARALELEVSLSFLADLAVRLYLRQVLARVAQQNFTERDFRVVVRALETGWTGPLYTVGVEYLQKVIGAYSYQKRPLFANYAHLARGKPAGFSLRIDYAFGIKPPLAT